MTDSGIVKIRWQPTNAGWTGFLFLTDQDDFFELDLSEGETVSLRLWDSRVCTGYVSSSRTHVTCPERTTVQHGSQCEACQQRDQNPRLVTDPAYPYSDERFALSLLQIGNTVVLQKSLVNHAKEGWYEAGADYAALLASGLTHFQIRLIQEQFEDTEVHLTVPGSAVPGDPNSRHPLLQAMKQTEYEAPVIIPPDHANQSSLTNCSPIQSGNFYGTITAVQGQFIQLDHSTCIELDAGRKVDIEYD